jgi:hypothetical protein
MVVASALEITEGLIGSPSLGLGFKSTNKDLGEES